MKIDMHVHTKYSLDGFIKPEKINRRLLNKKNIDGVAITDHDTVKGWKNVKNDISIIPGIEINTNYGEVMGFFIQENITKRRFEEVVDEIKDQGGLLVAPHPFDRLRNTTFKKPEKFKKHFDGMEVFNSRCIFKKTNDEAKRFADKNKMIKTAGSDSHLSFELGNAYVEADASDLDEFRKKLEKKDVKIKGKLSPSFYRLISASKKRLCKFGSVNLHK